MRPYVGGVKMTLTGKIADSEEGKYDVFSQ